MEISVQYYGMLAEITGQSVEIWSVEDRLSVGMLRTKIEERYPEIGGRKYKVAVNLQISQDTVLVEGHSEIALLPPFAGG